MGEQKAPAGPDLVKEGIPIEEVGTEIPVAAQVDGKAVIAIRTRDGVRVVGGRCTHYGGPLEDGLGEGGKVHCPWHHAVFDLATGDAIGAPALNPIPTYETTERDGRIFATGPLDVASKAPSPPTSPGSVVIVGSGAAGAAAAETLRRLGYANPIVLIGDEAPIDRPNLSKDYLAGTAPEEWMPLRSPAFYSERGIELTTGSRVARIDPRTQRVTLDDGREYEYGALLLAPGAEPRLLAIEGADQAHVHYLRTLEDSRTIISTIGDTTNAVVIGAGFIGLEVAASLRHRDVPVTVIAPEEVPLAGVLGDILGEFIRDLHEEHGVVFRMGHTVSEIQTHQVVLDDGSVTAANLVVVGVGVIPRTELAEQAGIEVDGGIVVDDQLRTSDPNIWAAGDAARYPSRGGRMIRVEHWVAAQRQGQTAAHNILGHALPFEDPPFFWSQHYDVPINVVGYATDWDEVIVRGDPSLRDVLVGFRSEGKIESVASIYRDLESLRAERALAVDDQPALEDLLSDPA
jgi:NADPH-dependent 2,4-dienoyl-CoA reductase/sulfur reductase-like enzyme/nitrite reductase/ring-hydroxylating ferredoxin subunit